MNCNNGVPRQKDGLRADRILQRRQSNEFASTALLFWELTRDSQEFEQSQMLFIMIYATRPIYSKLSFLKENILCAQCQA